MSSSEALCDHCVQIPLDPKQLRNLDKWSLGPWSRIQQSRCPLCRLVKLMIYEQYRTDGHPDSGEVSYEVYLEWTWTSGPGARGAFSVPKMSAHYICFATQSGEPLVADSAHHYLQHTVHPELDISRVARWLSACAQTHSDNCIWEPKVAFGDAFPGLQVMRLIDVFQQRLVEVRDLTRYAALSYIWGAVDSFRLTTANRGRLLLPGAIRSISSKIPRTILHAISLVRKLGIQYLWVDALCLLQNEAEDLRRGVQVMDQVYERSFLTIIAACGHDAGAGLPGVEPTTRRTSRLTLQVRPGTSLGVYTSLDQLIKGTVYNSRAWTFQEHILCRRALYFVDNKIFFRCCSDEFSESCLDHSTPHRPDTTVSSMLPGAVHMDFPLDDYATMLQYYSRRVLTYQGDALRTMEGIIRKVSDKVKCRFLQGLPSVALDAFLLFTANGSILHRRAGFPSYSWAGWRGGIGIIHSRNLISDQMFNGWLTHQTWVVWYKRSPSGITNLVWDPAASESAPIYGKVQTRTDKSHILNSVVPHGIKTSRTAPTQDIFLTTRVPPYPLLQFWTISLFYKLDKVDTFFGRCNLIGSDGNECGIISLDGFEETTFFNSPASFEVILLSGMSPINVMLLEWNEGIAERRGIGTLDHDKVNNGSPPGPLWKEIILG